MIDFIYSKLTKLIDKFSSPRETYGDESKDVLELKKYYEEQASNQASNKSKETE